MLVVTVCCCALKITATAASLTKQTLTNKMSRLREELQEFVLENVELFDEERVLGTGSYGSVQEVRLEQLDTE